MTGSQWTASIVRSGFGMRMYHPYYIADLVHPTEAGRSCHLTWSKKQGFHPGSHKTAEAAQVCAAATIRRIERAAAKIVDSGNSTALD